MIKGRFYRGSVYIDVYIKGRVLTFVTPLLNFVPIKIDLDKLEEQKDKMSRVKIDKETLRVLSSLKTEEEMIEDLKEDMIKSGWRFNEYK